MGSDREVPRAREMCSGVRSILGSLCRSADVQLWIDEEHAPRQRKVVKAFEQNLAAWTPTAKLPLSIVVSER